MSDTIENAKTEPRPTWTKLKDGWKVRIPKEWWDNWSEAGETDEFPVFKANGEVSHVNIVKVSKPFVLDGVEYVIGTPRKETYRRGLPSPALPIPLVSAVAFVVRSAAPPRACI